MQGSTLPALSGVPHPRTLPRGLPVWRLSPSSSNLTRVALLPAAEARTVLAWGRLWARRGGGVSAEPVAGALVSFPVVVFLPCCPVLPMGLGGTIWKEEA